jgi:hypothetical protein
MKRAHAYIGCVFDRETGGWVARCLCGFHSLPHFTKRSGLTDLYGHLREHGQTVKQVRARSAS